MTTGAAVAAIAAALGKVRAAALIVLGSAIVILLVRLLAVRPPLNRRSDRVLAGETLPHSRGHLVYAGLEGLKVVALVVAGVAILAE